MKKTRLLIGRAQCHRENGTFVLGIQLLKGETWNKLHCTFNEILRSINKLFMFNIIWAIDYNN